MSRIIKRYENRKLYDTQNRKYISLEELASLIRQGHNVKVIDKKSDNDITTQTLTQIILEEGKKGKNPLPKEILYDAIRWGYDLINDGIKQASNSLDDLLADSLKQIYQVGQSVHLNQLRKKISLLEEMINEMNDHDMLNNTITLEKKGEYYVRRTSK